MKKLRIHYFQHVAFEGLGSIEDWILSNGHPLTATRFFNGDRLPDTADFDMLIVMGGSMSVDDDDAYHWLTPEKQFIRKAVDAGKIVLGICLGSQLVSSALGSRVFRNKEKEIGWFDIELTHEAQESKIFHDLGSRIKTFHWHGDTFDLPEGAILLASSAACKNQAYIYKERVLALQCHFEPTPDSLQHMIDIGREELKEGKFVQTEEELTAEKDLFELNRKVLFTILNRLADQA
jgi:GMP synthase-like glutamine amidotransferase